jgi:hypothetical protein
MEEYFKFLPNEIQVNIFKKVIELNKIEQYTRIYNVNAKLIRNSYKCNSIRLFSNYYISLDDLPDGSFARMGDVVLNKNKNCKDIYIVAGFKSFKSYGSESLYNYFNAMASKLDRSVQTNEYKNNYLGLYKMIGLSREDIFRSDFKKKLNNCDKVIFNIMYPPENNINNEFSLHNSKDFIVLLPQNLISILNI